MNRPFTAPLVLILIVGSSCMGCEELGLPGMGGGGGEETSAEDAEAEAEASEREATEGSSSERDFEADPGTCNSWKVSYCAAVEACSAFSTHEDCQLDVGFVRCWEDAPFGECEEKIDAAVAAGKCEELPENCGPDLFADRTVPTQICGYIYDAICEQNFFCGTELSMESCRAALDTSTPCGAFTAALPESEACLNALALQGCGEALPPICMGVLRY